MASDDRLITVTYDDWPSMMVTKGIDVLTPNYKRVRCVNMELYSDGSLGTAPGWKQWTSGSLTGSLTSTTYGALQPIAKEATGSPEAWTVVSWFNSTADAWEYTFDGSTAWVARSGLDSHISSPDQRVTAYAQQFDAANSFRGAGQYHILPEESTIISGEASIDASFTVTGITWPDVVGSAEVTSFTLYRDRIWAIQQQTGNNGNSGGNRLFYSDLANYTSVTAGNYIEIGEASNNHYIVGIWGVRDAVLIAMSDHEWYAFSGEPDAGTLRHLGRYTRPAYGATGAVMENAVWFLQPGGGDILVATPQGVQPYRPGQVGTDVYGVNSVENGRGLSSPLLRTLYLGYDDGSALDSSDFFHLHMSNGGWSINTFPSSAGSLENRDICLGGYGGNVYVALARVTTDDSAEIFTRDIRLDRPGKADDEWSRGLNSLGSSGSIKFAPFAPPDGFECRAKRVIVDYKFWSTANYTNPDMEVVTLTATTDNNYTNSTTADAQRGRYVRSIGGTKFVPVEQVTIQSLQSVAIERVTVEYELRPFTTTGNHNV